MKLYDETGSAWKIKLIDVRYNQKLFNHEIEIRRYRATRDRDNANIICDVKESENMTDTLNQSILEYGVKEATRRGYNNEFFSCVTGRMPQ